MRQNVFAAIAFCAAAASSAALGLDTPTVEVLTPATAAESPTDGKYVVNVTFENAVADATWDLDYIAIGTVDHDGYYPITNGLAATAPTYTWDMSGLPSGLYFLVATVHSEGQTAPGTSKGSILLQGRAP